MIMLYQSLANALLAHQADKGLHEHAYFNLPVIADHAALAINKRDSIPANTSQLWWFNMW